MWLARLSVLGFAYFMVALAALHALRSEYDPLEETVSQYSIGPHGYLMTTAFFAIGLGVVALAVALSRGVMPSPRIGPLLLGLAGVCVFLVGVFPVDPASAAMPISEFAHDVVFMTSIPRRHRRDVCADAPLQEDPGVAVAGNGFYDPVAGDIGGTCGFCRYVRHAVEGSGAAGLHRGDLLMAAYGGGLAELRKSSGGAWPEHRPALSA